MTVKNPMTDPDAPLVAKCRNGDRAALELLFRRHVDRVWRYAWFATRSRESVGEIVQDVFIRVAKSVKGFEGRSTFATWLFAVARAVTMNYLRRRGREERGRVDSTALYLVTVGDPRGEDERGDPRDVVRSAVARLPAAQRDAIVLCELLGMSIAEAGEVLGWGQSRVKVTLFRARRVLREMLEVRILSDAAGGSERESG